MSKKNKGQKKSKVAKTSEGIKLICLNRKARFNFELHDRYEAGVSLTGSEVKSIRGGKVNITDGYADIIKGEVYLCQVNIQPYDKGGYVNHEPKRRRKLLLHRREIRHLIDKVEVKGMTLVPTKIYFKNSRVKVEVALATGKKTHDKRDAIKERDIEREMRRGGR